MNNIDKNIQSIPKLLRAMAKGSDFISHDILLNEAAKLIEHLASIREKAKAIVQETKDK